MQCQKWNNVLHFYLLGPYYVLEDQIGYYRHGYLEMKDCSGEVAVITGGNRGIGASITEDLLSCGMHVIIGCRNKEEGEKFVQDVIVKLEKEGKTKGKATVLTLDLASFASVRQFATEVLKATNTINYVINNAGIITKSYKETGDGFETSWQVNYLGHFLLTHLLLPTLEKSSGTAKIVSVTSLEHNAVTKVDYNNLNNKETFDGNTAYATSKLAQNMFTLYLDSKLRSAKSRVEVLAAHPGIVDTAAYKENPIIRLLPFIAKVFFKTPAQGAKPIVFGVLYGHGGQYIGNCVPQKTSSASRNQVQQQLLFDKSKEMLSITLFGDQF